MALAPLIPVTATAHTARDAAVRVPPAGWRAVTFGRASLFVPADWPIVDTSAEPTACVRFDLHALYLGGQGPQADCPATAIGHTDAVQVQVLDEAATEGVAWGRSSTIGGQLARVAPFGSTSRSLTVAFPDLGVLVSATYRRDSTLAAAIVSSVTRAASPRPVPPPPVDISPAVRATARTSAAGIAKLASTASGYVGPGFDACTAPSLSAMNAWLASPFRAVGIYIGGANRACGQDNLSSSWVTSVEGLGWNLMPLYVGLQAPCSSQGGMASISKRRAATQGRHSAADAVSKASPLGLGLGSPIYFDMEAYNPSSRGCAAAVEKFLSAWTKELHVKGYVSGVYGSSGSTMKELVHYYGNPSYASPDDIWFANWNDQATIFGDPYIPDSLWANHQRIHQYKGGHVETHPKSPPSSRVQVNIDSSQVDGAVVGKPAEGSFVRTLSGRKYRIAGGAPFRVTRCSVLSNCRPVETLSTLRTLAKHPADGTVIRSAERGRVYVVAGGAALRVHTCLVNPLCAKQIELEQATINALGYGHLLLSPLNGTELQGTTSSDYWRLRNGCRISRASSTSAVAVSDKTIASLFPLCQGTIAFDSGSKGHRHIFTIRADGNGLTRLTGGPADDTSPAISPNGAEVAFTRTANGNSDVFVMDIGGTGLLRLTRKRGFDGSPSWSPDGKSIAFQSDRAGNSDIWTMTAKGARPVRLTGSASSDRHPSWAPDGTTIAFESNRTGQFHLWTMTSTGHTERQLTAGTGSDTLATWSPGGTYLAYQSVHSGNRDIYVVRSDGRHRVRLTTKASADASPTWSPDGGRIAFISDRGRGGPQVFVMHSDGSWVMRYTSGAHPAGLPRWSA